MSSLTLFGTGCGIPGAAHFSTSALLEAGGAKCLLDAGEPCANRLLAAGHALQDIDAIFLSHGHSDHVAGLWMVLQGNWLEGRKRPLPVYLPGEMITPILAWLDAVYLPESLLGFPLEFHAWEDCAEAVINELKVTVAASTHLDGLREIIDPSAIHRFRAYSFGLTCGDKRWIHSADLGAPSDLDPHWAGPCDVLVCELSHYEPEVLFEYLTDKSVGRLYFTHLAPKFDADRARILDQAQSALPHIGEIHIPDDGAVIAL